MERTVICTTFYGFEKAGHILPDFHLTGPHMEDDVEAPIQRLSSRDPELFDWLESARLNDQKVIYISLGSQINWQPWYVENLYKGILNL